MKTEPEGAIGCRGLHFPLPPKGSKYSNDIPMDDAHFKRKHSSFHTSFLIISKVDWCKKPSIASKHFSNFIGVHAPNHDFLKLAQSIFISNC